MTVGAAEVERKKRPKIKKNSKRPSCQSYDHLLLNVWSAGVVHSKQTSDNTDRYLPVPTQLY